MCVCVSIAFQQAGIRLPICRLHSPMHPFLNIRSLCVGKIATRIYNCFAFFTQFTKKNGGISNSCPIFLHLNSSESSVSICCYNWTKFYSRVYYRIDYILQSNIDKRNIVYLGWTIWYILHSQYCTISHSARSWCHPYQFHFGSNGFVDPDWVCIYIYMCHTSDGGNNNNRNILSRELIFLQPIPVLAAYVVINTT